MFPLPVGNLYPTRIVSEPRCYWIPQINLKWNHLKWKFRFQQEPELDSLKVRPKDLFCEVSQIDLLSLSGPSMQTDDVGARKEHFVL